VVGFALGALSGWVILWTYAGTHYTIGGYMTNEERQKKILKYRLSHLLKGKQRFCGVIYIREGRISYLLEELKTFLDKNNIKDGEYSIECDNYGDFDGIQLTAQRDLTTEEIDRLIEREETAEVARKKQYKINRKKRKEDRRAQYLKLKKEFEGK